MKILALETSAQTASAAIVADGRILAEINITAGLTHSQTLIPAVNALFETSRLSLRDMDLLAVSHGPGSFTGIRIGIGAVKGMAQGAQKPCLGISTLKGIAYNFRGLPGIVCPVMDARCKQVYTALFEGKEGGMDRLWPDDAISIADLGRKLRELGKPVTLTGDGAELCFRELSETVPGLTLAPVQMRLQRAACVGLAAADALENEASPIPAAELMPVYLHLPQAERELNKKLATQTKGKEPTT